jgi:SAM-dependent methyltransferase
MSWNLREGDWLTEPTAIPGSGPIDALDGQVLATMGPTHREAHREAPIVSPPAPDLSAGPGDRAEFSASISAEPDEAQPVEQPPAVAEEPLGFHIPTLAFGVQASASTERETDMREADLHEASEPASEAPGLVMPTLSRMKWVPAPEPAHKAPDAPVNVAVDVYDDEDAPRPRSTHEAGHPDVLEQVDSAELELMPSEDAAGDEQQDQAPEVAFVIPTLARPDTADRLDISLDSPTGRDDIVIPMLMRAEPAAAPEPEVTQATAPDEPRVASAEPSAPSIDEVDPTAALIPAVRSIPSVAAHADEVEEFEEVEADAIESLDVADLVETEAESVPEPEADEPEAKPRTQPPEPQQKRRKAWYDDVFAEHFMFLFPQTWDETAQRDAQFIHDQLGLREGANVLDVGCGDGHHAIGLAKLGHNVTGIDNSLAMLLAAAQQKEAAGIDDQRVTFMHGDMRRLPRDREFEAVMCVGTTFGYFEEEQNRQCLQEMVDRLAVGGRLLLHVFNRDFVAPHLPSRSWWQGRRCMVIDEAEMNFFANRLRVHRTIIFDDGRQYEHFMFMRAYTVQDLGKAVSQLGLRVVEVSGSRDTRARFYGSASPDIWIVAERK